MLEQLPTPTKVKKPLIVPVITTQELSRRVELLVIKDDIRYGEAIISICNELDLEPEDISKLVTGPLKDKLEAEAQRRNFLPKPSTSTLTDFV